MRVVACVPLLTICLALGGCQSLAKKLQGRTASQQRPSPVVPPPRDDYTPPPPAQPAQGVGGIIAGQVVDNFNRNPKATVYVITPSQSGDGAPVIQSVTTDNRGYFTIVRVKPGQPYQLVARVQEGGTTLSGSTWVRPPDARVVIRVSEDFNPPALPGAGKEPPAKIEPPTAPPAGTGARGGPAAEIGSPIGDSVPGTPPVIATPRPENIATGPDRRPMPVEIPNPWKTKPPEGTPPQTPKPPPAGGGHSLAPTTTTPVPSCQLVGDQLINFALADLDGRPWEFRRDRRGKLVLLDFWRTTCVPCQHAISHLVAWNNLYGGRGLEIIGIAYEQDPTFQEQVRKVRSVAARKGINYRTLMGYGSQCPVWAQFQVKYVPTLILLDEEGRIIWRNRRPDQPLAEQLAELEFHIAQRLGRP